MKQLFQIFQKRSFLTLRLQNIKDWDEFRSIYFASFAFTSEYFQRQNFRYWNWSCNMKIVNYFRNRPVRHLLIWQAIFEDTLYMSLYRLESQLVILQQLLHHQSCRFLCLLATVQFNTAGWHPAALKDKGFRTSLSVLLSQSLSQAHLRSKSISGEQWFVVYMQYEWTSIFYEEQSERSHKS